MFEVRSIKLIYFGHPHILCASSNSLATTSIFGTNKSKCSKWFKRSTSAAAVSWISRCDAPSPAPAPLSVLFTGGLALPPDELMPQVTTAHLEQGGIPIEKGVKLTSLRPIIHPPVQPRNQLRGLPAPTEPPPLHQIFAETFSRLPPIHSYMAGFCQTGRDLYNFLFSGTPPTPPGETTLDDPMGADPPPAPTDGGPNKSSPSTEHEVTIFSKMVDDCIDIPKSFDDPHRLSAPEIQGSENQLLPLTIPPPTRPSFVRNPFGSSCALWSRRILTLTFRLNRSSWAKYSDGKVEIVTDDGTSQKAYPKTWISGAARKELCMNVSLPAKKIAKDFRGKFTNLSFEAMLQARDVAMTPAQELYADPMDISTSPTHFASLNTSVRHSTSAHLRPTIHPPTRPTPDAPLVPAEQRTPSLFQRFAEVFRPLPFIGNLFKLVPDSSSQLHEASVMSEGLDIFRWLFPSSSPGTDTTQALTDDTPLASMISACVDVEASFADPMKLSRPQICPEPPDVAPLPLPSPSDSSFDQLVAHGAVTVPSLWPLVTGIYPIPSAGSVHDDLFLFLHAFTPLITFWFNL